MLQFITAAESLFVSVHRDNQRLQMMALSGATPLKLRVDVAGFLSSVPDSARQSSDGYSDVSHIILGRLGEPKALDVTLLYVSLRFVSLRYVSLRSVKFRYAESRYVLLRFVTFRSVTFRYVASRDVSGRAPYVRPTSRGRSAGGWLLFHWPVP